jgi:hypothetical protein
MEEVPVSIPSCSLSVSQPVDSVDRVPFLKRIPVTMEYLATVVGRGIREDEDPNWTKARTYYEEALYEGVAAMVHMFAVRYSEKCPSDIEDLEQECFKRIFRKLGQFDAKRAKFSTWTYHVCSSVLNGQYRKNKKHMGKLVPIDSVGELPVSCADGLGRADMIAAIAELYDANPQWKKFLRALFGGDPSDKRFDLVPKIGVMKACRRAGVPYAKVHPFYINVVRPFFRERFCEGDCGNGNGNG